MNDIVSGSVNFSLKENQIVSLDYLDNHLYGEVIQLISDRQMCWFRPLCLILADSEDDLNLGLDWKRSQSTEAKVSKSHDTGAFAPSAYSSPNQKPISQPDNSSDRGVKPIDLQSSSDLLWPDSLFRPALDSEIIGFLPQLADSNHLSLDKKSNQKCLNKFVYLVWQAHQDKF